MVKNDYICPECGKTAYRMDSGIKCSNCKTIMKSYNPPIRPNLFEKTRAQVYSTGNKWAIENFNATH